MPTKEELTSQSNQLQVQVAVVQDQFDQKLAQLRSLQNVGEDITQVEIDLDNLRQQSNDLNDSLNLTNRAIQSIDQSADPKATIKSPEATNPDQTEQNKTKKYENAEVVGATNEDTGQKNLKGLPVVDETGQENPNLKKNPETGELYTPVSDSGSTRANVLADRRIPPGAEKPKTPPAQVNVNSQNVQKSDSRVRIRVPDVYLKSNDIPGISTLRKFNGILFPYTPQISFDHTAQYATQQPMHSNFAINFYQRSFVSNISITGDFTVQNNQDAEIYIGTMHLLSALTKMRFGNDSNAGSPPPVCRLDAYGVYVLKNVPIAISNFRVDLPKNVDYYGYINTISKEKTLVPITAQINMSCVLMYSRREMQEFTVDSFLNTVIQQKRKGFI